MNPACKLSKAFCWAILLNCLMPLQGWSQMQDIEAELRWGNTQKAPAGSQLAKVIAAGSWGAQILRYRHGRGFSSEKYWLEHFDGQMTLVNRFEFELQDNPRSDLEDIINLRGQLYLLMSRPVPEEQISRVVLRPIGPSAQVIGEERVLAELPLEEKYRRRQFDLEYSRDSSFLLLYNQLPPEKGGPERFTLRVFDEDITLVWSQDVELSYKDKGFGIRSYQVDREGNVYVLGRKEPESRLAGAKPLYVLYAYTRNGREEVAYQLDIEDVKINNLTFRIAGNGDIVCAGFYGVPGLPGSTGICHIRINPISKESYKVDLLPFTDEFIDNSRSRSSGNNGQFSLQRYRLRELTLRSDGGIVLVAEQYHRQQATSPGFSGGLESNTFYSYNDIIVANISPEGDYTWLRQIPKRQETANDGGFLSSFAQATVQDRFLFLYNDHPDNFSPDKQRQYNFNERNAIISLTEINRAGRLVTIPLFVNRDAGVMALPRRCQQIGARLMLVYGEDGRNYRLGLLAL